MTKRRECGDCQLCCKLLPTEEINKPANTRCSHQKSYLGCKIYPHRPLSCQLWNCRWLVDDDMADQPRPDRSHIVVDMMPDVIRMQHDETGEIETLPVIVAWVDPAHSLAINDLVFRRYVERQKVPVLLRYGSGGDKRDGVLFPPGITGQDEIVFRPSSLGHDMPRTLREKAAAIGATMSEAPSPAAGVSAVTLTMPDGSTKTVAATTGLDVLVVPSGPPRRE